MFGLVHFIFHSSARIEEESWPTHVSSKLIAISALSRTSTPARPPFPSVSSITPGDPTKWAKSTTEPPSWTGWSRNRNGASPSPPPSPPATGETMKSISSTPPATSISPLKWNVPCECWTVRWRSSAALGAWNPNRKPSGIRRTGTMYPKSRSSIKWTAWEPIFPTWSARSKRSSRLPHW